MGVPTSPQGSQFVNKGAQEKQLTFNDSLRANQTKHWPGVWTDQSFSISIRRTGEVLGKVFRLAITINNRMGFLNLGMGRI